MVTLASRRHERPSVIVTSNKAFSAWGEMFCDDVVAAAMIDRLVYHVEIIALKDDVAARVRSRLFRTIGGSEHLVTGNACSSS
jgi:DNA replication protein DnaC